MIADEVGIEILHPGVRTIIDSQTEQTHVVRIEYAMAESIALPQGSHLSCLYNDLLEHHLVLLFVILRNLIDFFIEIFKQVVEHVRGHLLFETSAGSSSTSVRVSRLENLE